MKAGAVIVAGGQGKRMGISVSKQLLKLGGITILERTLKPFTECPDIRQIVIVAAENIIEHIEEILHSYRSGGQKIAVTRGGGKRQDSVYNGIIELDEEIDIVTVHDAVRPFITPELIGKCIHAAREYGAVSVMRPLKETVKIVSEGTVVETPKRSTLWITQTPQAFVKELIIDAHQKAGECGFSGTDDCMLVERLGHTVHVIEGNDMNIKITTKTDLILAETILKRFTNEET